MGLLSAMSAGLAKQLGHPSGLRGRAIGVLLNRANRRVVTAAVDALDLRAGETAADIGFGGGFGLGLLLAQVGDRGAVHGFDISATMLTRARRRFRRERAAGLLRLHDAGITALPMADGSVDAAITVNTVYFVADLEEAFGELARVLSPSGRVVVGIGDPETMSGVPVTAHGFRLRPVAELTAGLTAAGLVVEQVSRVGKGDHAAHLLVARSRSH